MATDDYLQSVVGSKTGGVPFSIGIMYIDRVLYFGVVFCECAPAARYDGRPKMHRSSPSPPQMTGTLPSRSGGGSYLSIAHTLENRHGAV